MRVPVVLPFHGFNRRLSVFMIAATVAVTVGSMPRPAHAFNVAGILGILNPASPQDNPYAGCMAAAAVADGTVFPSVTGTNGIGAILGAVWNQVSGMGTAQQCKQVVDSGQSAASVSAAADYQNLTTLVASYDNVDVINDGFGRLGGVINVHVDNVPGHTVHVQWKGSYSVPAHSELKGVNRPSGVTWYRGGSAPPPNDQVYSFERVCSSGDDSCGGMVSTATFSDIGTVGLSDIYHYGGNGGFGNDRWNSGACTNSDQGSDPPECRGVWGRPGTGYTMSQVDIYVPPLIDGGILGDANCAGHLDCYGLTSANYPLAGFYVDDGQGNVISQLRWSDPGWSFPGSLVTDQRALVPQTWAAVRSTALSCLVNVNVFLSPSSTCSAGGQSQTSIINPPPSSVPPSTKRPLIFVPGIAGSQLAATSTQKRTFTNSTGGQTTTSYKSGDVAWANGAWLLPGQQENNDVLRFQSNGSPLYNDFVPNGTLVGLPGGNGYPNVSNFFSSQGYTLNKDFFVYTYDWRFDVASQAQGLDQLVRKVANGGQVDIIAHSMGTMVTRQFLLTGQNLNQVHRVALLAGPNLGTPQGAYAAMAGAGVGLFGGFVGVPGNIEKYIYETLPGGLDQAPSSSYYSVYHDQDQQHPVPYADLTTSPNQRSYADLRNAELASGVYQSAITPAESFHGSDLTWPQSVDTSKISLFSGTGQCTPGQIQVKSHPSGFLNWFGPQVKYYDFGEVNGDGTVTVGSSSMDNGQAGGGSLAGNVYYRGPVTHSEMGDDPKILADALAVVQGSDSVDHGAIAGGVEYCRSVSIHSPMEVLLTDSAGNRVGGLSPNDAFQEAPNSDFWRFGDMKVATLDPTSPFTATVHGTGTGDSMIKVRTWSDTGLNAETVFTHVSTTPNTTGSFTFNGSTVSALTVDVDGDGKNVITVQPTTLTGAALNDVTPPTITITSPSSSQAVVGSFPVAWTATDSGSGVANSGAVIDLNGQKITLSQPGEAELPAGQHTLDVGAEDRVENVATAHLDFPADAYSWLPPLKAGFLAEAGRTIPVKFTLTTPAGAFVSDQSVLVDLVDPAGNPVTAPMTYGTDPAHAVVILGNQYHGDLRTTGLARGSYSIRVRFNSPSLLGTLMLPVSLG